MYTNTHILEKNVQPSFYFYVRTAITNHIYRVTWMIWLWRVTRCRTSSYQALFVRNWVLEVWFSSSTRDTRICQFEIVLLPWQIYQMFLEIKAASALDRDVIE